MNPRVFDKNSHELLFGNYQSAFKLEPILHKPAAPIISDERVKEVLAQRGQKNPACVRCQARNVRCDRQKPRCSRCIKTFAECIYKGGHKPVKQEQVSPQQVTLPKITVPPEYVPLYDITLPPLDPSRIITHLKKARHA